jgi:hypothetical protein
MKHKIFIPIVAAAYAGCLAGPPKNENPAFGPGAPAQATAPAEGTRQIDGTPPPTPSGALPVVVKIVAPKTVTIDQSILVSGIASSPGSANLLTYQWSIVSGPVTNCNKPDQMTQPHIELCTGGGLGAAKIRLVVNNGQGGTAQADHDIEVLNSVRIIASGLGDGAAGNDITMFANDAIDNRVNEYPDFPQDDDNDPESIDVTDVYKKTPADDGVINAEDVCRVAQKFLPRDRDRACEPKHSPPHIKRVRIRDANPTQISVGINIDLDDFNNPETGLKIREFRIVNPIETSGHDITIANVRTVVIERAIKADNVTIVTGVGEIFADKTTGSNTIINTNVLGGVAAGNVTLVADPTRDGGTGDIIILGGVQTKGNATASGGDILIDTAILGANPGHDIILSGDIDSTGNAAGTISIFSNNRLELRRFRQFVTEGAQATTATGVGGGGGDIAIAFAKDIFLENLVMTTVGGPSGTGNVVTSPAGGKGGDVSIVAEHAIVVGESTNSANVINTRGGQSNDSDGSAAGGEGGEVALVTIGTGDCGIYGIGGVIDTRGGDFNNGVAVASGPGGTAGEITLAGIPGARDNSIFWTGNLLAIGGDSRIANSGTVTAIAGGIGAPVSIVATATRNSSIVIDGNIRARRGRGSTGGGACAESPITLTAQSTNSVNGAGSSSVKVTGQLDTRGGLTNDGSPNTANDSNPAGTAFATTRSNGSVNVTFGGFRSSDVLIEDIETAGGDGEAGTNGCPVTVDYQHIADDATEGPATVVVNNLVSRGGDGLELGAAGTAGAVTFSITHANSRPSRYDIKLPNGIIARGGNHTAMFAANGDDSAAAGNGNNVLFDLDQAQEIIGDIGVVDITGGDAGVPDDTRTRNVGTAGTFTARLGDNKSTLVRWDEKNIEAAAGTFTGSHTAGTVTGNPAAPGAGFTLTVDSARYYPVDVEFKDVNFNGGNGIANNAGGAVNGARGGAGMNADLTLFGEGKYTFGTFRLFGGNGTSPGVGTNGQDGGDAGSFTVETFDGRPVNLVFGDILTYGGTSEKTSSVGGTGALIEFNIPTLTPYPNMMPSTIVTAALKTDGGLATGTTTTNGGAGSIHHRLGSTSGTYSKIDCTTASLKIGGITNGSGGNDPCIDEVFDCATPGSHNTCRYDP